jgi:hypothetical protein
MAEDTTPASEPVSPHAAGGLVGPQPSTVGEAGPEIIVPKDRIRRSRPRAKPAADPKPGIVLHWLGDESRFTNGIPNRDVTTDDRLSDEDLQTAVEHGTHERS